MGRHCNQVNHLARAHSQILGNNICCFSTTSTPIKCGPMEYHEAKVLKIYSLVLSQKEFGITSFSKEKGMSS